MLSSPKGSVVMEEIIAIFVRNIFLPSLLSTPESLTMRSWEDRQFWWTFISSLLRHYSLSCESRPCFFLIRLPSLSTFLFQFVLSDSSYLKSRFMMYKKTALCCRIRKQNEEYKPKVEEETFDKSGQRWWGWHDERMLLWVMLFDNRNQ